LVCGGKRRAQNECRYISSFKSVGLHGTMAVGMWPLCVCVCVCVCVCACVGVGLCVYVCVCVLCWGCVCVGWGGVLLGVFLCVCVGVCVCVYVIAAVKLITTQASILSPYVLSQRRYQKIRSEERRVGKECRS